METKIQDAVKKMSGVASTDVSEFGKPAMSFVARIVGAEYSAIEAKITITTLKMDDKGRIKRGEEHFLLRNENYRKTHLTRAAYAARIIDPEFALPEEKNLKGNSYQAYCKRLVKTIQDGCDALVESGAFCVLELWAFDRNLKGQEGMIKKASYKATFKPLPNA